MMTTLRRERQIQVTIRTNFCSTLRKGILFFSCLQRNLWHRSCQKLSFWVYLRIDNKVKSDVNVCFLHSKLLLSSLKAVQFLGKVWPQNTHICDQTYLLLDCTYSSNAIIKPSFDITQNHREGYEKVISYHSCN